MNLAKICIYTYTYRHTHMKKSIIQFMYTFCNKVHSAIHEKENEKHTYQLYQSICLEFKNVTNF